MQTTAVACHTSTEYQSSIAQQAWDGVAVISRLPYQCTTNRVDVNWSVTVIIRFRLAWELNVDDTAYSSSGRGPQWRMDTNFQLYGGWAGHFWTDCKTQFLPTPAYISCPRWGWFHQNIADTLYIIKIHSPRAIVQRFLHDPTCSCFGATPACDRQADRQTEMQWQQIPCE